MYIVDFLANFEDKKLTQPMIGLKYKDKKKARQDSASREENLGKKSYFLSSFNFFIN
jgi:hypothetical protein